MDRNYITHHQGRLKVKPLLKVDRSDFAHTLVFVDCHSRVFECPMNASGWLVQATTLPIL